MTTRALLIPVGFDFYAVPTALVREVVAAPPLCSLPTAPSTLLGLFNLRGEIVPLLDTASLVGVGQLSAPAFVVVVRTSLGLAGLAASGIPESVVLEEAIGPSECPGSLGVYAIGDRLAVLIDVNELLTPARIV
jgi:purine-binding chemotaxis protein CheW